MRYIKEFSEFNSNSESFIIVIDNTMPPEKKYLANIINYLEKSRKMTGWMLWKRVTTKKNSRMKTKINLFIWIKHIIWFVYITTSLKNGVRLRYQIQIW